MPTAADAPPTSPPPFVALDADHSCHTKDALDTFRQLHKLSTARAYAEGPFIRTELKRHEDGRSVAARLSIPTAKAHIEQLVKAVAEAEASQAAIDARFQDNGWERETAG